MARTRNQASADSLLGVITILEKSPYPESTWVGKDYTKADLIRDLKSLKREEELSYG